MKNWLPPIGTLIVLAALAGGCANAPATRSGDIPDRLRVPATAILTQKARAAGVQVYRCDADKADAAHFAWILKGPEADLFDRAGTKIGRHYSGPTWEARDGSKVIGEVLARADSPDDSNGIAWLLLRATSTSGSGIFATVQYVQRLHTVGGMAPSDGCNHDSAGREARVPYSADYWFYAGKS